jgi:hypothetical protein
MSHAAFARVEPDGAPAATEPDVNPEVRRLRLLIERQPTCLLRIGMDGLILAANDAALGQLAARQLGQALGHRLAEWLPPDQSERWLDYEARVRASGAASMECDLRDLSGNLHAVQLHGVSQPGHPDGVASMIVTIRDVSGVSRMEKALQEHESTRRALQETRARLEAVARESAEREAALEQRQARFARDAAQLEALLAGAVRTASQARRLVQIATGQVSAADAGHAADATASDPDPSTIERARDRGRSV